MLQWHTLGGIRGENSSSLKMADNFNGLNGDKKMEHDKSSIRCKIVWKTFNFCMEFEKYDI